MVQFNPSFNVGKVSLTPSTQTGNTGKAGNTERPKAEINAVYDAGTSIWHGGDATRRIKLDYGIKVGDIVKCFDANLRFLGFDENGYGIYEEIGVIPLDVYDPNRGERLPGT